MWGSQIILSYPKPGAYKVKKTSILAVLISYSKFKYFLFLNAFNLLQS